MVRNIDHTIIGYAELKAVVLFASSLIGWRFL